MGADDAPRWRARLAIVAMLGAVAAPVVLDHDSFPLSTYPIYAHNRDRIATFSTAVGIGADGKAERLSLQTIAGTDDPLIVGSLVASAVRSGRADDLCSEIAGRAASRWRTIEVVDERRDIVAWTAGRESLLDRTVHARCEVPG